MRLNSGKVVVIGQKWLYSDKSGCIGTEIVVFGQTGCVLAKDFVFGIKWFY